MYERDVPKIKKYVKRKGEEGLLDVGTFVLCSIQTPISRVGPMVKEVKREGSSAACLWGSKRDGYVTLRKRLKPLYEALVDSQVGLYPATRMLLDAPGLGLPKVSFLLQCIGYDTACLDVHNLRMYDIPYSVTKVAADLKEETKEKRVKEYIRTVSRKTTGEWWNDWSNFVANNRWNRNLETGDMVSDYHYHAISGQETKYQSSIK